MDHAPRREREGLMGVFDFVRAGVREMMVARPDEMKSLVVYKHPNQNVPMYAQLTVDSDECAVFFKDGRVVGVIPPGRVTLQSQNFPFLNRLVTRFTGGDVLVAEVFFVKMSPVRSVPFGGPIGDMIDPLTGEEVQPRIFGEMSIVVVDPVKFVVGYSGQAATGDNDYVLGWIKGLFMNGVKTTLGELCDNEGRSLLQVVALTSKLAAAFVARAPDLNDVGVRILQVGTFNINFSDEDRKRLVEATGEIAKAQRDVRVKQIAVGGAAADAQARQFQLDQQFNQDGRYVRELAGSYQAYAAGQAAIGAGRGMAEHGADGGGALGLAVQMAVGMGVGNAFAAGVAPRAAAPAFSPGGTRVMCGHCGAKQPGGKFCVDCGTALVGQTKFCSGCEGELIANAKFCPNCGLAVSRAAPAPTG
jgi:membrane protease subunit (stomatin/prohibitin family)